MTGLVGHRGGAGPPVVLLHGVASSWRDWAPVVPDLERDHDVIALGFPGHAGQPPFAPGVHPDADSLADAACAAMDDAGIGTATVAGSSLGGWIALLLARRGRADGVLALSPAGLFSSVEAAGLRRRLLFQHRVARLVAPFAGLVERSPLLAGLAMGGRRGSQRPAEVAHKLRAFADCPVLPELLAGLEEMGPERLEGIRCPVVVGWGEQDPLLPVRFAGRFARALPAARVVRLRGAGHLPTWDEPATVAGLVRSVAGEATIRHAGRR
ncbi:alpha/beta hydrolase [bacterium]|nr:alpha/beta hydrolase [bacterium]